MGSRIPKIMELIDENNETLAQERRDCAALRSFWNNMGELLNVKVNIYMATERYSV